MINHSLKTIAGMPFNTPLFYENEFCMIVALGVNTEPLFNRNLFVYRLNNRHFMNGVRVANSELLSAKYNNFPTHFILGKTEAVRYYKLGLTVKLLTGEDIWNIKRLY